MDEDAPANDNEKVEVRTDVKKDDDKKDQSRSRGHWSSVICLDLFCIHGMPRRLSSTNAFGNVL